MRKVLLACGLLSSLLYVAANVYVPTQFPDYYWISQTVSELSAINAPTRDLWLWLVTPYGILLIAFGVGIVIAARGSRSLTWAGALLILHGLIGFFWPPMHLRGDRFSLTDTLHIVFSMVTVLLMLLQIVSASIAFGRRFRIYSAVTILVMLVFGFLTSLDAPNIAADLPTPFVGIWERISILAYMLWIAVFAMTLMSRRK